MSLDGLDIFVIAVVVLVLWLLFAGIKTVPQGFQYTVERFGRYTRTLEPVSDIRGGALFATAAHVGGVRLIDNVEVSALVTS